MENIYSARRHRSFSGCTPCESHVDLRPTKSRAVAWGYPPGAESNPCRWEKGELRHLQRGTQPPKQIMHIIIKVGALTVANIDKHQQKWQCHGTRHAQKRDLDERRSDMRLVSRIVWVGGYVVQSWHELVNWLKQPTVKASGDELMANW